MKPFEYFEPTTVSEGISLLAKYRGKAKVIAGGTDLIVEMKQGKKSPQYVIDLKTIPGLNYINYDSEEGLRLGALTTIRALEQSAEIHHRYPAISQAASRLGHVAIRNIATLGGNLCNAVPSADMAPALIGLSAKARMVGPSGERILPLEDFFVASGKTALNGTEILIELQIPVPPANTRGVYFKYAVRATGLPIVGVAVIAVMEPESKVCRDIKIVLGNVAPTPMRAHQAEALIRGRRIDEALINQSAQVASDEAHPRPSSVRASPQYKKEMVRVFTKRAIMEVTALASERG